jgi:hypothetical protein
MKLNKITKEEQSRIDAAGLEIMETFARYMQYNIAPEDTLNKELLQKHYDWFKIFSQDVSKVNYMKMINSYVVHRPTLKNLNKIRKGLPNYIKSVALKYVTDVK